jgi:hypothetical protein
VRAACLPWCPRHVLRPRTGSSAPLDAHTVGGDLTVLRRRIASSSAGHSHAPDAACDTLPYVFFENFLAASACTHLMHPALPHFVSVPPAVRNVPSAGVPRLAMLDSNVGLPSRPQCDNDLNPRGYT